MLQFSGRVFQKYDLLTAWETSANILKAGEIGVGVDAEGLVDGKITGTNKGYMLKVGDGVNTWANLPILTAIAGDVGAWAKEATVAESIQVALVDNQLQLQVKGSTGEWINCGDPIEMPEGYAMLEGGNTFNGDQVVNGNFTQKNATDGSLAYLHGTGVQNDERLPLYVSAGSVGSDDGTIIPNLKDVVTMVTTAKTTAANQINALTTTVAQNKTEATNYTNTQVEAAKTAANTYTDEKVAGLGTLFTIKGIVDSSEELPEAGTPGDVYLVGTSEDKREFVWVEGEGWEPLGQVVTTDLTDYATMTDVNNKVSQALNGLKTLTISKGTASKTYNPNNEDLSFDISDLVNTSDASQGIYYDADAQQFKLAIESGNGLNVDVSGKLKLNLATDSAAGALSAEDKAKLDGIAKNANNYTLPAATSSALGGVKIGNGLAVTLDGVLSADVQSVTVTSTATAGSILAGIGVNGSYTNIYAPYASKTSTGVMKAGDGLLAGDIGNVSVNVGTGLKIADNAVTIDETVVFNINCGNASTNWD